MTDNPEVRCRLSTTMPFFRPSGSCHRHHHLMAGLTCSHVMIEMNRQALNESLRSSDALFTAREMDVRRESPSCYHSDVGYEP